ncbi:hypothetical protein Pfo_009717 [Paulownia fortunei]|nr:hypothetical protein Pfo_009717 [Paulownia fortunei]
MNKLKYEENNTRHAPILIQLLKLCVLCVILVSEGSSGADYRHEACVPRSCGYGPNISFPFYIPGQQESYCGYPGFALNCSSQGFPILHLPENDYVVEDIFYGNSSFRVYDAAVSSSNLSSCPRIRNTTLPTAQFAYANNVTGLHLFSNCSDQLPGNLGPWGLKVSCDSEEGINNWALAIYDKDFRLKDALENCARNVIAPVEGHGYDGNNQSATLVEVFRRGFVLNWTASDCRSCVISGGRCGFNSTTYRLMCFCPDRPHSRQCNRSKFVFI